MGSILFVRSHKIEKWKIAKQWVGGYMGLLREADPGYKSRLWDKKWKKSEGNKRSGGVTKGKYTTHERKRRRGEKRERKKRRRRGREREKRGRREREEGEKRRRKRKKRMRGTA